MSIVIRLYRNMRYIGTMASFESVNIRLPKHEKEKLDMYCQAVGRSVH